VCLVFGVCNYGAFVRVYCVFVLGLSGACRLNVCVCLWCLVFVCVCV